MGAGIEHVEDAQGRLDAASCAQRELAAQIQLQIARRLVQYLALAPRGVREAPGGGQRIRLRGAVRQSDLPRPEYGVGSGRDQHGAEVAARLNHVASGDSE